MATLSRELRNTLENVVLAARKQAELGALKALDQLAVAHHEPWTMMTAGQQSLRRRLRARGRQLGDRLEGRGTQGVEHLVAECAYEQWHRMLFARFLAECGLLIEPASGVPVSVDECKELARERHVDWISLASTFAQGMLPQIFRADDAVLEIALPPEHRQPLEQLLTSLPAEAFLADDSLGWVYQFWQSQEKERINESETEIGADELPAVTQLFTEDYMVEFLLHNTLGAWWAGRTFPHGVVADSEERARMTVALPGVEWRFLRFVENEKTGNWIPVAGTFSEWPDSASKIRVLDPCMGSGHFLVFALPILVAMRMAAEVLSLAGAQEAVLRDNLFGLEIDPRCTQIAAFNLALAAWKLSGWHPLPPLNLACSGLALNTKREDWMQLAGNNDQARSGMERLYELFSQAPVLGSLINPRSLGGDLLISGFREVRPLLDKALQQEQSDDTVHELAVTAQGVAKACEILADQFTLVITNVPYLGRGKQGASLQAYCEGRHLDAKADLATCFVERSFDFCHAQGTTALVSLQNWWFTITFKNFRKKLLIDHAFRCIASLGEEAWQSFGDRGPFAALTIIDNAVPSASNQFVGIDALPYPDIAHKILELTEGSLVVLGQRNQYSNPDHLITIAAPSTGELLGTYARSFQGIKTGDDKRFCRRFWELSSMGPGWRAYQSSVSEDCLCGGMEQVINWADDGAGLARRQGLGAWDKHGVLVCLMRALPVTRYFGHVFSSSVSPLVPHNQDDLPALWAFCSSRAFRDEVKKIDKRVAVTNGSLQKVHFDIEQWRQVAMTQYPKGLPEPHSDDPSQWIFDGAPRGSNHVLQVAVARLLGYRWPRQSGSTFPGCGELKADGLEGFADEDGIVCISATRGEDSAVQRLTALLAHSYGGEWSAGELNQLLGQSDYAGRTLDDWLRNRFFDEHCKIFRQRPYIWNIWDGRNDGFSALVNCHKLTKATLETLTYAHLGDWILRQQAAVESGEPAGEARLIASTQLQEELKKILDGEPPYDIFVRWKPVHLQPVGWQPDPNDGVRVNIRPFMTAKDVGKKGAGILRTKPSIAWEKDDGKEQLRSKDEFPWFWRWDGKTKDFPGGSSFDGNRWNELHYSREFKMAARRRKGLA